MRSAWMLILGGLLIWLACQTPDVQPRPDRDRDQIVEEKAPFPSQTLSVLIVEDVQKRRDLPLTQLSILTSAKLRQQLRAWNADYRIWDDQIEISDCDSKFLQALRLPRETLPWIYIANKSRGYSGPLPATLEETLELIGKYR